MEIEFAAWQEPLMKFPQDPLGFPKLAKLMDDMRCPEEHWSRSSGIVNELTVGWSWETWAQTVSTYLVRNEIPEGSPPTSSSRTNTFFVGCSHERGTWYLIQVGFSVILIRKLLRIKLKITGAWHSSISIEFANPWLPFLSWLSAVSGTVGWGISPSVIAVFGAPIGGSLQCYKIAPNMISIYPCLPFAHGA